MYASAFCGVMTMFPTVGVASANTEASPIICAVTPAELTPFHVFEVVVTTREMRRQGFALLEFVRMMVGVLLPTRQGMWGHVISAWLCTFAIGADRTISSPATVARIHRPGGVSAGPRV